MGTSFTTVYVLPPIIETVLEPELVTYTVFVCGLSATPRHIGRGQIAAVEDTPVRADAIRQ